MIRRLIKSTMKVLTVVLSFCGGNPPTSISNQINTMNQVKNAMNFCTDSKVVVAPFVWPDYVDICPNNCDPGVIANEVASQINLSNERYVIYILPKEMQCDFAGLGTVGPCVWNRQCNSWINGHYANSTSVYLHELGHNLGLGHAKYNGNSYGDLSDVMGACCTDRCYNAVHLDTLRVKTAKISVTYPVSKPIKVILCKNEYITIIGQQRYYLQNRQKDGYDQVSDEFGGGINVYTQHLKQADSSELLMMIRNTTTVRISLDITVSVLQIDRNEGTCTICIHRNV